MILPALTRKEHSTIRLDKPLKFSLENLQLLTLGTL